MNAQAGQQINAVKIVGTGLIGTSIGLALAQQGVSITIDDADERALSLATDLLSDFPAASARAMGLEKVPLICAVEMAVPASLPRTIRLMLHCHTELDQDQISHIYLRGAVILRKDIAQ